MVPDVASEEDCCPHVADVGKHRVLYVKAMEKKEVIRFYI